MGNEIPDGPQELRAEATKLSGKAEIHKKLADDANSAAERAREEITQLEKRIRFLTDEVSLQEEAEKNHRWSAKCCIQEAEKLNGRAGNRS